MPETPTIDRHYVFRVDDMGIPIGRCADCAHCKFKYKDDKWHCETIEFKHEACNFELG